MHNSDCVGNEQVDAGTLNYNRMFRNNGALECSELQYKVLIIILFFFIILLS